jgi:hypothetical protein
LEESVLLAELLVNMTKEHDPRWPKRMHNLGCAYFDRYQATRPELEESLNDAIRLLQRVSVDQDIKYLEKPRLLADLQLYFHHLYRMTDQLDDQERSMEFGERARRFIPPGDKLLPKVLSNPGNAYHDRHDDFACAQIDLDRAIDYARLAVSATTPLDPQLSHRQEILGTGLYTRRRSKEDIREAISLYMAALDDASVTGSKRGRRLDNLGAALFILFRADGHIDDLTGAIHYYELAVAADIETNEEHAERVGNLGAAYFELYERNGQGSDLEVALKYAKLATQSVYKDRKHEPKMVNSLARMYHRRFLNQRVNTNTADPHEAIRLWKRAIELVPPKRPERAQFYSNFGTGMENLYEESNDIEHLEKALEHWAKGVSLTSQDNPDRANRGTNLGHGYYRMFRHTNDMSFQRTALDLFLQSLRGPTGTPFDRMLAGQKAADVAQSREDWSDCADYLAQCIELLPK